MAKNIGVVGTNYGLAIASSNVGMTGGTNNGTVGVGVGTNHGSVVFGVGAGNNNRVFSSGGFDFSGASVSVGGIRLSNLTMVGDTCTATVNGRTYTGKSINAVNGVLHVDGKPVNDDEPETKADGTKVVYRTLKLEIAGHVQGNVDATGDVTIKGSVTGSVHHQGGSTVIGGSIGGGFSSQGGKVNVAGDVYGSMSSQGGSVTVHGKNRRGERPPPIDLTSKKNARGETPAAAPKKRARDEDAAAPAAKKARTEEKKEAKK